MNASASNFPLTSGEDANLHIMRPNHPQFLISDSLLGRVLHVEKRSVLAYNCKSRPVQTVDERTRRYLTMRAFVTLELRRCLRRIYLSGPVVQIRLRWLEHAAKVLEGELIKVPLSSKPTYTCPL